MAIDVGARDHHQTLGLFGGIAGTLIGDVGGRGRALEQQVLLGVIVGADLPQVPGESQPRYGSIGRDHDDLAEDPHAAAVVAALKGGVDVAPQLGNRLRHLARVGLDLGFELDRRFSEIIAFEYFVGGDGGGRQQQDERGCKRSANERAHGGTSVPAGVGKPNGAARSTPKHVEVVAESGRVTSRPR